MLKLIPSKKGQSFLIEKLVPPKHKKSPIRKNKLPKKFRSARYIRGERGGLYNWMYFSVDKRRWAYALGAYMSWGKVMRYDFRRWVDVTVDKTVHTMFGNFGATFQISDFIILCYYNNSKVLVHTYPVFF